MIQHNEKWCDIILLDELNTYINLVWHLTENISGKIAYANGI